MFCTMQSVFVCIMKSRLQASVHILLQSLSESEHFTSARTDIDRLQSEGGLAGIDGH